MKFSKSENHDPNYLAAVVEVTSLRKHSNADRLQICTVFGNDCIVGLDTKVGDKYIFFPLESQISAKILSAANLFSDPNLNADGKSKGYFENKVGGGRVKAVRLRGERSAGFLMKAEDFAPIFGYDFSQLDSEVGTEFDTLDGETVCQKYIPSLQRQPGEPGTKREKVQDDQSIAKRLIPNQFRLHGSTPHLGRNLHLLTPDTMISITEKLHGQNAVFSNVLVRTKEKFINKLAKFFGADIKEKDYHFIYSSRSVMKTRRDGSLGPDDQWGIHAKELENKLPPGFTVVGELIGFAPTGKAIQSKPALYDYKCEPKTSKLKVFRVTYTDPIGEVIEFSWPDIVRFCEKYNLETVPVHYYGQAKFLQTYLQNPYSADKADELDAWRETFLKNLEKEYLDKQCPLCDTKVVNEGVVVSIEDKTNRPVFKFKSFEFQRQESADRDKGLIEEEEE